jgi:hypothetical protein
MEKCVRCVSATFLSSRANAAQAYRLAFLALARRRLSGNSFQRQARDTYNPMSSVTFTSMIERLPSSPSALRLGASLGCRDPEHIARWAAALNAGKAKLRCSAVARSTAAPCRRVPLKFADRCSIHCRGAERIRVDRLRLEWLERKLSHVFYNVRERTLLEARIDRIRRRALRWAWRGDPTVPGSTIALQAQDVARAEAWLRDVAGVEAGALTARGYDKCMWASALAISRRYGEDRALFEVRKALRADERWRAKTLAAR